VEAAGGLGVFSLSGGQPGQVIVLIVLSGLAAGIGAAAAWKGAPTTRVVNGVRAVLAFGYMCGYIWLLEHLGQRAQWSEFMSGFGLIVWPVVWIYPPAFTWIHRRDVEERIRE
jgi:hypothetical protein